MDDRDATVRLGIRLGLAGLACGFAAVFSWFFGIAQPVAPLAPLLWMAMFVLGVAGIVASAFGLRTRPKRAALGVGIGLAAIVLPGVLLSVLGILVLLALSHGG